MIIRTVCQLFQLVGSVKEYAYFNKIVRTRTKMAPLCINCSVSADFAHTGCVHVTRMTFTVMLLISLTHNLCLHNIVGLVIVLILSDCN